MPSLRLTVVLPTFNRAGPLRRAIAALQRQSLDRSLYEVVVVDNNSTDGTSEFLASVSDARVRTVRESRQGLSFARNAAIAQARGDIVAFTDDDVEVAPDWAETIVTALDGHPDVDGVGGRVLPAWANGRPRWLTREHWAPLALQDHGDAKRVFDRANPIGLVGANVALKRRAFERVGLFAPSVQRVKDGIGSTEDHEFLSRLYASGGRMLYVPRLLVLARVQYDRCTRRYHRRWHEGHGRFHALMRTAEMERSRFQLLGVPSHLLRSAASDAVAWIRSVLNQDWDGAFAAELRLRFFEGYVRTRIAQ
jgi:glycosyltransferase involved in cell wall biosynthesis